jgi:pyrroloquinoline-quinone synthase
MYSLADKYDLLTHPFYQAWKGGKLTREDLKEYACEYYLHVFSLPVYLKALAARLPQGELRNHVLDNLSDELGMHHDNLRAPGLLWVDFAIGAGASANDVLGRMPIGETTLLLKTFLKLARKGSPAEAVAAFYVYESQMPKIAKQKGDTLRNTYGLDEAACRYFTLHAPLDIAHAMVWREQLEILLKRDPDAAVPAIVAAERVAKALWRALDGINAQRILRSQKRKAQLN